MRTRYIITQTSSGTTINREIFPKNGSDLQILWQQGDGNIYKPTLSDGLLLTDDDYQFLIGIEQDTGSISGCTDLILSIQQYINSAWQEIGEYKINIKRNAVINTDKCTINIQPLPNDGFDKIEQALDNKINIFNTASQETLMIMIPELDIVTIPDTPDTFDPAYQSYLDILAELTDRGYVVYQGLTYWAREYVLLPKDSTPSGAGWAVKVDNTEGGYKQWARHWNILNPTPCPTNLILDDAYYLDPAYTWVRINGRVVVKNSSDEYVIKQKYYYIPDIYAAQNQFTYSFPYGRGRLLNQIITDWLAVNAPSLTYQSRFLQNSLNPLSEYDDIGYNPFQYITISNASDVKKPKSTEPAGKIETTMRELLNFLNAKMNLHWSVEGDKFVIEHIKYYDNALSYATNSIQTDLTTVLEDSGKIVATGYNEYSYIDSASFKNELFQENESYPENYDFADLEINYDGDCLNNTSQTKTTGNYYSDVYNLIYRQDAVNDTRLVVMCHRNVSGVLRLINGQSVKDYIDTLYQNDYIQQYINGGNIYLQSRFTIHYMNWCMSWKFILAGALKYDRVLTQGFVFGKPTDFETTIRNKQQIEISWAICEDIIAFDPARLIKTYLGNGKVQSATYSIRTGRMTVILLYN